MHLRSLKSKLLVGVSALVICSGVLISFLVSHQYSESLLTALNAQAEYLTSAIALQAADMVLTNDLVALQKMLDQQLNSNPSLSYLFIEKDGRTLADTFADGIPVDLLNANEPKSVSQPNALQIVSTTGEHYLDMAMPIFDGKAGTLRLGFSEQPYRQEVKRLWLKMILFTFGILMMALAGSLLFIKRITEPLGELARAVDKLDHGELDTVQVGVRGRDEVGVLAESFNHMLTNLNRYTRRLEEQTMELERAHQQTRTFCGIVQEIGALQTLREIGRFLVKRFSSIVNSEQMLIMIYNEPKDTLFFLSEKETRALKEPELIQKLLTLVESPSSEESLMLTQNEAKALSIPDLIAPHLKPADRYLMVPFGHPERSLGLLCVACAGQCRCNPEEVKLTRLMLNHAAPVIKRAVSHEEEVRDLQCRLESSAEFCGMVARDPKMQVVFRLIEDIAPTDASVLIQGESGTGKELVARAIHQLSPRNDKPFIIINCSAYPASLLESELFGHEKGAFTGAIRLKSGRFELADGGTVFLDEIGEIPPSAQIKLLRVLQTQEFERVGGEKTLAVDVRILAATNKNLLEEVKKGDFREDLYYRLGVIPILLPPLRERSNDIPLLARHFLNHFARVHGKSIESFGSDAMRLLLDHPWPGNVRELENTIEHAVVLAKGAHIEPAELPVVLRSSSTASSETSTVPTMAEHESELLQRVLDECAWNKKETAQRLGISRNTLYNKIKKYRIRQSS